MKRFILPASLLAVLLALGFWFWGRSGPGRTALHVRALATRGLADYLVKTFPGRRALVISNPFTTQKGLSEEIAQTEMAGVRGLKEGFETKLVLEAVVFPSLKPEAQKNPRDVFIDPETTTPLSFLVADNAFDDVTQQHPNCELVVSLIGLPAELKNVQCWQKAGPPRFALLLPDLRVIGDAATVRSNVQSGKLAAFVLNKPGAPGSDSPVGGNWSAEFEKRFLLVTAQNIDLVMETYPRLFRLE